MLSRILDGLSRNRNASPGAVLEKGYQLIKDSLAAKLHLRGCTTVGEGAIVDGHPRVENRGRIAIGKELELHSRFAPAELIAEEGGALEIGDSVWINFGCVLHARKLVRIGDRTMIGQYAILADTEMGPLDRGEAEPKPITVGADVWIAGRVTVLPGVTIGDGAVITAGSVVSSDIPPGVVAGGIPARVLRSLQPGEAARDAAKSEVAATSAAVTAPVAAPRIKAGPKLRGVLISDLTISELAHQLARNPDGPNLEAEVAPFGQVIQSLLGAHGDVGGDFAVVWTMPESTLPGFRKLLDFEEVKLPDLLAEVDAFCAAVEKASPRFKFIFVPTWTLPPWQRGLGAVDARENGATRALAAANQRLWQNLARTTNVHVLDASRWLAAGGRGYSPRGWYLGKVAFHTEVFAEAAADIKAALRGLTGQARKLLVFDLDDTLWGGVVGDAGWENLKLGGHDPEGEAMADLQRIGKALRRRGVLLAIVSKNEESVALEAIRKHPNMVLREEDFVARRINWTDKARNIAEIAAELNLGLQSVVFIDDNPVERARVREALPEVFVPEWPVEKLLYPSALLSLRCFDVAALTQEDAARTELYQAEKQRDALLDQVGSIDEWLKSLNLRVRVEPLCAANLARTAQLFNKTNQLNLSTRRLSELELVEWTKGAGRSFWTLTVIDRFGDAGLTGIVSMEARDGVAHIVDFILSCRVMGRKVEETMLHIVIAEAARLQLKWVEAAYRATAKNKPTLTTLQKSGFHSDDGARFVWDAGEAYPLSPAIALERTG